MKFTKYHALGNDYIVIDPKNLTKSLTHHEIKTICHRNYGVGSDGILLGPTVCDTADFALNIYNPDGSEAEKSGNGLRIFSRYLWDCQLVGDSIFSIQTKGGLVQAQVESTGQRVTVDMGQVSFTHEKGVPATISEEELTALDQTFTGYRANVGNPHFVIPVTEHSEAIAKLYGPVIENDDRFVNRSNVQFLKVIDRNNIQIEIWERGAGYTLASGSSSTAAAATAHALGLCDQKVSVHMPGGVIEITIDDDFFCNMKGAVSKICDGEITLEAFSTK